MPAWLATLWEQVWLLPFVLAWAVLILTAPRHKDPHRQQCAYLVSLYVMVTALLTFLVIDDGGYDTDAAWDMAWLPFIVWDTVFLIVCTARGAPMLLRGALVFIIAYQLCEQAVEPYSQLDEFLAAAYGFYLVEAYLAVLVYSVSPWAVSRS